MAEIVERDGKKFVVEPEGEWELQEQTKENNPDIDKTLGKFIVAQKLENAAMKQQLSIIGSGIVALRLKGV